MLNALKEKGHDILSFYIHALAAVYFRAKKIRAKKSVDIFLDYFFKAYFSFLWQLGRLLKSLGINKKDFKKGDTA